MVTKPTDPMTAQAEYSHSRVEARISSIGYLGKEN